MKIDQLTFRHNENGVSVIYDSEKRQWSTDTNGIRKTVASRDLLPDDILKVLDVNKSSPVGTKIFVESKQIVGHISNNTYPQDCWFYTLQEKGKGPSSGASGAHDLKDTISAIICSVDRICGPMIYTSKGEVYDIAQSEWQEIEYTLRQRGWKGKYQGKMSQPESQEFIKLLRSVPNLKGLLLTLSSRDPDTILTIEIS